VDGATTVSTWVAAPVVSSSGSADPLDARAVGVDRVRNLGRVGFALRRDGGVAVRDAVPAGDPVREPAAEERIVGDADPAATR
jgi:hypothetical protein